MELAQGVAATAGGDILPGSLAAAAPAHRRHAPARPPLLASPRARGARLPPTLSARSRAALGAARSWMPGTGGDPTAVARRGPAPGMGGTYLRCERPGRSHPRPSYSRRAASGVDTASGAAEGGGRGKPAARFPVRLSSSSNLEPQPAPISPPPAPPPAPVGHTQPRPSSLPFSATTGLAPAGKSRGRSRRPVLEAQLSPAPTTILPPGTGARAASGGLTHPGPGCKSSRVLLQPHREPLGKESPWNDPSVLFTSVSPAPAHQ